MSMTDDGSPRTTGIDHVGLSVRDLESTRAFFCEGLGWRVVGERKDYPAAFISDGESLLTLWQVESPGEAAPFDRRANVGLHHLAVAVADREDLDTLHLRLSSWPGVVVEFAPQVAPAEPANLASRPDFAARDTNFRPLRRGPPSAGRPRPEGWAWRHTRGSRA